MLSVRTHTQLTFESDAQALSQEASHSPHATLYKTIIFHGQKKKMFLGSCPENPTCVQTSDGANFITVLYQPHCVYGSLYRN